ncbi:hypothetical protein ACFVHB_28905 [Kitasatospora sp. NPDC127111]|uniref:hypothetical protein n=1 Tax=Kitasatospora sp. NPDC127111 TaxID=3345363 RepID=UPI00362AB6AA
MAPHEDRAEGDEWQLIVADNTVTTVEPERGWVCEGCRRLVGSEDAVCRAGAETWPVWLPRVPPAGGPSPAPAP